MSKVAYSLETVRHLESTAADPQLHYHPRLPRHETGEVLSLQLTSVHPRVEASATFVIEKFIGGGFAGQVYRCRLQDLTCAPDSAFPGLEIGRQYAIKILIPPSRFSVLFRNTLYWFGYQAPFMAQVDEVSFRHGVVWQKLVRQAAADVFGRTDAVKDVYATFWDPEVGACGEVTEWVEGRTWLLEADDRLAARQRWRACEPQETGSPEYVAKRQFMARLVELLHEMGGAEFARQYEWWTMKSQPNTLKRTDDDTGTGPEDGLCAIDFRAGLVLLPFLPMSPGDIPLILSGVFRRGSLVQFDRCDPERLRNYAAQHPQVFAGVTPLVDEFPRLEQHYRDARLDLTHNGLAVLWSSRRRQAVREGLIKGYAASGLADPPHAERLRCNRLFFAVFYILGALPILGGFIRRMLGNSDYRRHIADFWTHWTYFNRASRAGVARRLVAWHRSGRTTAEGAAFLVEHRCLFWLSALTLGVVFAPFPGLQCMVMHPRCTWKRVTAGWAFIRSMFRDPGFREAWFLQILEDGRKDGMLSEAEHAEIAARVREPFIVKYLQCLGVHIATLPITQIVSVTVGAVVAGWLLVTGKGWPAASGMFALIVAAFQVTPISPGSLCRGGFVLYLMVRERNLRDYVIAAPLSFVKYIGYLAFPLQMTTTYPHLARFMAGRWATSACHIVPVFGEKGALLEHWVFDLFFNIPQVLARWAEPRLGPLLTGWMGLGAIIITALYRFAGERLATDTKSHVTVVLATIVLFFLPRLLFYPLLRRPGGRRSPVAAAR